MKTKITKQYYNYQCPDGCCDESGYVWTINGEKIHNSPCEDSALLAILDHLGIEAELTFLDGEGEETSSL